MYRHAKLKSAWTAVVACLGLFVGVGTVVATSGSAAAASLEWGPPVSVDPGGANGVNTEALEGCPAVTPDGLSLYFASNRDGQLDIWVSYREEPDDAWALPERLPSPVNVEGFNDFCPTPLSNDELLFVSARPGGCAEGSVDIYRARRDPAQGWLDPEHLGCDVNSSGNEFAPSFVPSGGGVLFFSSDRDGGAGNDKIFSSRSRPAGGWDPPVEVTELNAEGYSTARPNVSRDGLVIVFDSNREGGSGGPDIWMSTRSDIDGPWSEPVNLRAVNTSSAETRAWLSADGTQLYFGSNREGGEGNLDLYVSSRR